MSSNRRRQLILKPLLQFQLGVYCIALAIMLAVALIWILHSQWLRFNQWLSYQKLDAEALGEIERYASEFALYFGIVMAIYIVTTVAVSILLTHRMVGPTVAFRRHIRNLADGNYSAKTILRRHDAFDDVADELNGLSEALNQRHGPTASGGAPVAANPETSPAA